MTSPKKTVQKFLNASNEGDFDALGSILADDFTFAPAGLPHTFSKDEFLGMMRSMRTAFPDFTFSNVNFTTKENPVKATLDTTGTHTGVLDATPLGMGRIQPTGKTFRNAQEPATWNVEDGKVTHHTTDDPNSGPAGMFQQLGIDVASPTG